MNNITTGALTRAAIIAALYAALTLLLAPISYGEVQIRFSEALTILPVLLPEAVPALAVGCLLSNILGGCTIFDIVFGTLATLLAALCTRKLRDRFWLAALMPVLFNAVVVGAVITQAYNGMDIFSHLGVFALNAAQVGLGEAGVMLLVGYPLTRLLPEKAFFRELIEKCK